MDTGLRHLACQAYLHSFGFATLGVAALGLGGHLLGDSAAPMHGVILPDSSLAALLLGTAVLASVGRRPALAAAAASLVLLVALYRLALTGPFAAAEQQPLFGAAQAMPAPIALLFCLTASGLLCSRRGRYGRLLSGGLGVAIIALALLSLLPAFAHWRLGVSPYAQGLASLFALGSGLALLGLNLPDATPAQAPDRISLYTGLFCVLLTCAAWYLLSHYEVESDRRRSELMQGKLGAIIERASSAQLLALRRMAERWGIEGRLPTPGLWLAETRGYLRDLPGFDLIALVDAQLQPKWLSSRSFADTEKAYRLLDQEPLRRRLHGLGRDDGADAVTVRENDIAPHSIVAMPLNLSEHPGWLLLASLDLTRTLDDAMGSGLEGFRVRILEQEQLLYDSHPGQPTPAHGLLGERFIRGPAEVVWRLASYPAPAAGPAPAQYIADLVLPFGLGLSLLIMLSQRLRLQAVARSRDLQQANTALQASLQRQTSLQSLNQRIMQHSLDLLCSIDAQGRISEINGACEAMLGYRPEELVGRPYLDYVLAEDRPRARAVMNAAAPGGVVHDLHLRYGHKHGGVVHLLWSGGWSTTELSFFCVGHDITNLVRSEAYLEDQRDILGMISTNQPLAEVLDAICRMTESREPSGLCAVLQVDASQRRLHLGAAPSLPPAYNQAVDGMAIGPAAGACGTAVFRRQLVITENIASDPLWQDLREPALGAGLRACWSIPLLSNRGHALGSLAIYHRQALAPDDEQLQLLANAAQLAAIAIERDQDHSRLQESEQRFRSLFSFSPNAVVSLDLQGRIESLNQAACNLLGEPQELLGSDLSRCVPEDDLAQLSQRFVDALGGEPQRFEGRCIGLQGRLHDLNITLLPIRVDARIVGIFAIARDIGERKLAQRKLQDTLQELQRSNADLQEFAFVASHDLQEPLRKIQAFSERLEGHTQQLDAQSRDYLERMRAAASRMQALIRDLLAYSRVGSRAAPFEALDTEQILDEVLRDMETSLAGSGAEIQREPLPALRGDATQIRQLLQNLLSNAVKFHQDGQPPRIRIYAEPHNGSEWTLCVEDQGIGFDEKYLERIFNPFQRLHGRQSYPGTGIGLAIVKKIAERHGARLDASSSPGAGSRFRVTFSTAGRE